MAVLGELQRTHYINRIDRIMVFQPLSRASMRRILGVELGRWCSGAGSGGGPGARPMKQAIEQHFLAPLSIAIFGHDVPQGDQLLFVRRNENRLRVESVDPDRPDKDWRLSGPWRRRRRIRRRPSPWRPSSWTRGGSPAESEVILGAFENLAALTPGQAWRDRKDALLSLVNIPAFWQREDRHGLSSEFGFRDRFEASLETLGSLLDRTRIAGKRNAGLPPNLSRRIALRLFVMENAWRP